MSRDRFLLLWTAGASSAGVFKLRWRPTYTTHPFPQAQGCRLGLGLWLQLAWALASTLTRVKLSEQICLSTGSVFQKNLD